jgi:hypothetical protein
MFSSSLIGGNDRDKDDHKSSTSEFSEMVESAIFGGNRKTEEEDENRDDSAKSDEKK